MYKPIRPNNIDDEIRSYDREKTPYFFKFAKDKTDTQVKSRSNRVVNRIPTIIKNTRFNFSKQQLGYFNYKMLMSDKSVDVNTNEAQEIINVFHTLSSNVAKDLNKVADEHSNYGFVYNQLLEELFKINSDKIYIADVLVKQLFYIKKSKRKNVFWDCFGDVVVENLKNNLKENTILCERCGQRVEKTSNRTKYCEKCAKYIKNEQNKKYLKNQ